MDVRLDWLGVATYRLTVGDIVLFLDAYMDRVPGAPPVGMSTAQVERADWVLVGHSHSTTSGGRSRHTPALSAPGLPATNSPSSRSNPAARRSPA
jgi:hypothetical protein